MTSNGSTSSDPSVAEALTREGRCHKQVARTVSATPHARLVLRRFVRHARGLPR